MNKVLSVSLALVASLALFLGSADDALAKRLGGGKSFGSRPSYSETYRPSPNAAPMARNPQQAYQSASQQNQAMRDSFRSRGGLMGMLGGLALGGMLGAMLFGGAFEHLNFLDILIFGVIAYLLFRMLASRRRTEWGTATAGTARQTHAFEGADWDRTRGQNPSSRPTSTARFDTDLMFGQNSGAGRVPRGHSPSLPADFDVSGFLVGAQNAYRQMQAAWDERDLPELRALTTDRVFAELQDQLRSRVGDNRTDVLNLEAQLLDVQEIGDDLHVSVLFDALLREADGASPSQIQEVWHFTRNRKARQPTWYLDGIQQAEV